MKYSTSLLICVVLCVSATGSFGWSTGIVRQSAGVRSLMNGLRADGAKVKLGGKVTQPFITIPGRSLTVNGAQVQVFEFKTEAAAAAAAGDVDPGGSKIGRSITTWMAPPHFYRNEIIAIYRGTSSSVIEPLIKTMSEQFAGK